MKTKTREKKIVTISNETMAAHDKLLAIAGRSKLLVSLDQLAYPISVIVERNYDANQQSLDGVDSCGMKPESFLSFRFGDSGIVTETVGDIKLPQSVITQLLNAAKKWHYLFLWDFHSRQIQVAEHKKQVAS